MTTSVPLRRPHRPRLYPTVAGVLTTAFAMVAGSAWWALWRTLEEDLPVLRYLAWLWGGLALLSLLATLAGLVWSALARPRLALTLPTQLHPGDTLTLRLTPATNRGERPGGGTGRRRQFLGRLGPAGARVRVSLESQPAPSPWRESSDAGARLAFTARLGVGEGWSTVVTRRGRVLVRAQSLEWLGVLGLWRARWSLDEVGTCLVLPRPTAPPRGWERGGSGEQGRRGERGVDGERLAEVRPYRRGDALSQIHWKQSARLGELVSVERRDPAAQHRVLVLDMRARSYEGEAEAEAALSLAYGVARAAVAAGIELGVCLEPEDDPGEGRVSARRAGELLAGAHFMDGAPLALGTDETLLVTGRTRGEVLPAGVRVLRPTLSQGASGPAEAERSNPATVTAPSPWREGAPWAEARGGVDNPGEEGTTLSRAGRRGDAGAASQARRGRAGREQGEARGGVDAPGAWLAWAGGALAGVAAWEGMLAQWRALVEPVEWGGWLAGIYPGLVVLTALLRWGLWRGLGRWIPRGVAALLAWVAAGALGVWAAWWLLQPFDRAGDLWLDHPVHMARVVVQDLEYAIPPVATHGLVGQAIMLGAFGTAWLLVGADLVGRRYGLAVALMIVGLAAPHLVAGGEWETAGLAWFGLALVVQVACAVPCVLRELVRRVLVCGLSLVLASASLTGAEIGASLPTALGGQPDLSVDLGANLVSGGPETVFSYRGIPAGQQVRFTLGVITDLDKPRWSAQREALETSSLDTSPMWLGDDPIHMDAPLQDAQIRVENLASEAAPTLQSTYLLGRTGELADAGWHWVAGQTTLTHGRAASLDGIQYSVAGWTALADGEGTLVQDIPLQAGTGHSLVSFHDPREITTAIPGNTPQTVRDLAVEVVGEVSSPLEAGGKLATWFHTAGFSYSTEAPGDFTGATPPAHVVARFLRERSGYCIHYASAFALMARSVGVPTRIAVGYASRSRGPDQWNAIPASALHAWPEVWDDVAGWVAFEPTPGGAGGEGATDPFDAGNRAAAQAAQNAVATPAPSQPTTQETRPGGGEAAPSAIPSAASRAGETSGGGASWQAWVGLGAALLLATILVSLHFRRRSSPVPGRPPGWVACWRQAGVLLGVHGGGARRGLRQRARLTGVLREMTCSGKPAVVAWEYVVALGKSGGLLKQAGLREQTREAQCEALAAAVEIRVANSSIRDSLEALMCQANIESYAPEHVNAAPVTKLRELIGRILREIV